MSRRQEVMPRIRRHPFNNSIIIGYHSVPQIVTDPRNRTSGRAPLPLAFAWTCVAEPGHTHRTLRSAGFQFRLAAQLATTTGPRFGCFCALHRGLMVMVCMTRPLLNAAFSNSTTPSPSALLILSDSALRGGDVLET